MKRTAIFLLGLAACGGAAQLVAADLAPGAIYVHTARDGTTLTSSDKGGQAKALNPGTQITAQGQILNAPPGLAAALVLSNGNALYLPNGGRLTLQEFTQEPVTDTGLDRSYEPSRSNLRLSLDQGTLAISGRNPTPTSTFILNTPLAQINSQARSLVVAVGPTSVTITVLDGVAEVTAQGTQSPNSVQTGQTVTITRQALHDAQPLTFTTTTTDAHDRYSTWVESVRRAESTITFSGPRQHLLATLRIPVDYTLQVSAEDPRFL